MLDAAKRGDLPRVRRLLTPSNINCRDAHGRNSTPLHLAGNFIFDNYSINANRNVLIVVVFTAGYNNLEVAELLVERGAEVDARDKGGLIPLHNASSYGHADVAALLIRSGTSVNATDKWGFAPLHEAAQKGRTQLCALLVSYNSPLLITKPDNFNEIYLFLVGSWS